MAGSNVEPVFDSTTVSSGGGTKTSSELDVSGDDTLGVQIDGDSNSSNLSLRAEAKARNVSNDSWTELDTSTVNGEDITSASNNSRGFSFDVESWKKVRFVAINDAGSDTTIQVIASRREA